MIVFASTGRHLATLSLLLSCILTPCNIAHGLCGFESGRFSSEDMLFATTREISEEWFSKVF